MHMTRRTTLLGAAAVVAGCAPTIRRIGGITPAPAPEMRPVANASYDAWVSAFRARATSGGISQTTLDAAFRSAGFLPGVVERDRNQTEFTRTLEDYLAIVASDTKVANGRAQLARTRNLLAEIEARYGVPAPVVAAIWGVESDFGSRRGDIPVISATSTLAFDGRRGQFFESQLLAALRILQNGDTSASQMTGSWAGAMGHTQFIPTTYATYAVDLRGDGRRDIWSDDPTDALASAAVYLSRSGWQAGQPSSVEVRLPAGFDTARTGRDARSSVANVRAQGVTRVDGGPLPGTGEAAVLIPAGITGPAFAVYRNFDVILRYNNSINYAIGVGYLADRLAGGAGLRGTFPPDRFGLSMAERQTLQRRLTAAGYDTGGADGVVGSRTEAAIRAYEQANRMPITGTPSRALLQRLG